MIGDFLARLLARLERAADGVQAASVVPQDGFGTRKPVMIGFAAMLFFFGLLGSWAAFAKLEGAVIATGVVKVDGNRKTVQHIDGGIVKELAVREGDRVKAGQTLIVLDETQVLAQVTSLWGTLVVHLANEARLKAERDALGRVRYPDELVAHATHPSVAEAIATQDAIFRARQQALMGEISVLSQRLGQIREQIAGVRSQMVSQRRQAELTKQELDATRELYDQGFATLNRVLALDRGYASYEGQASQYRAEIARLEQLHSETQLSVAQVRKIQMTEITRELSEVQARILDLRERLTSARDVLGRVQIVAPIDGYVVGLTAFTVGGVINRGDRILDVVPTDAELVIEAMVRPEDIENVKPGAVAEIKLPALRQRDLPRIEGRVRTVSADRLTDPQSGMSYFTAQIGLDHAALAALGLPPLSPGMPAEAFIKTAERSVLDYLVSPLTESVSHAFRER
jgi:epimerase transport system membrane fusion protein